MPTTATITPTLGSAPVTLQAGNYSAIDDRRFWTASLQEGVLSGGSYQVIQRAAGANMTVDVASSVGNGAVVQGDSVTAQGGYFVAPTAANVNVDIATADATNPRNDLVVLEIKDDQHDASGLNLARVRVITGTPNASAAIGNAPGANGTPALPSSCMLLAVVNVTAGLTSVVTARISDRRPVADPNLTPNAIVHVRDEKAQNTAAQSITTGDWRTRELNTVKTNTVSGASLASNQVTLPAGTYWVQATAPGIDVALHQARLQNITAGTTLLTGTPEYAPLLGSGAGSASITKSDVIGQITLTAASAIELQHRVGRTSNGGFPANFATEVYAEVIFWRTA
jgi:hypothetical protein